MAVTEALLPFSGLVEDTWREKEAEESMATMRARLLAMTWAAQAKDAALHHLQKQLQSAIVEAEQGRRRETALLQRARRSEEAEEALASQMAELEAETFTRITDSARKQSIHARELERQLQAALEDAAVWAQRCKALENEAEQGRVREAAIQRRLEIAEEAEEALASEMAGVEAEAFSRITESSKALVQEERYHKERDVSGSMQVAELERRLAKAEEALEEVGTKLRQAEEKNWRQQVRLVAEEGEKAWTAKRKEEQVVAVSLQDLAGCVNLKLWNPSYLSLTSPACAS